VGYQSYRISSATSQQDSEAGPPDAISGDHSTSAATLDRLRNLGLIVLLLGVLMLLLAVWR
jgi:hypothetical protein